MISWKTRIKEVVTTGEGPVARLHNTGDGVMLVGDSAEAVALAAKNFYGRVDPAEHVHHLDLPESQLHGKYVTGWDE